MNKSLLLLPFLSLALCAADISISDGSWSSDEEEGGLHTCDDPELPYDEEEEGGPRWAEPKHAEKSPRVYYGQEKKRKRGASVDKAKQRKAKRQKDYRAKLSQAAGDLRQLLGLSDQRVSRADILRSAAAYIEKEGVGIQNTYGKKKKRSTEFLTKAQSMKRQREDQKQAYLALSQELRLDSSAHKITILRTAYSRIEQIQQKEGKDQAAWLYVPSHSSVRLAYNPHNEHGTPSYGQHLDGKHLDGNRYPHPHGHTGLWPQYLSPGDDVHHFALQHHHYLSPCHIPGFDQNYAHYPDFPHDPDAGFDDGFGGGH